MRSVGRNGWECEADTLTERERERVGRERRAFGIREAAAETRVGGPRARGGVEVKTQGSVRVGKI